MPSSATGSQRFITPAFITHVYVLAVEELRDLLLRRRAVVSLLLYVVTIGSIVMFLATLETKIGPTLGLFRGASSQRDEIIRELSRRGLQREFDAMSTIISWPTPLVIMQLSGLLWFPTLVALVSCDMVAIDIYRGTLRFLLLRTSRLAYYVAKTAAHFVLYGILYVLSLAAILMTAALKDPTFSISTYLGPTIRYAVVLVPFLLFLVTTTQFVSCWSSKPMRAVVRLHLLWIAFMAILLFAPWASPLNSLFTTGLVAPVGDFLTQSICGMLLWSIIFGVLGFAYFARRAI